MSLADAIDNAFAPLSGAVSDVVFFSVSIFGVRTPLVLVWLVAAAVTFTISFRFVNLRGFRHAVAIVSGKVPKTSAGDGEISHFQALSSALSGTVGLGNIASVPVAVCLGGPGAIFWMVVAGFLGMSSKFAECALAVKYRTVQPNGAVVGGPMFYIENVLARRGLPRLGRIAGVFFAVMTIGASVSLFQVNQSHAQFQNVTGLDAPLAYGVVISAGVAIVILGGIRTIGRVTRILVPAMAAIYIVAAMTILLAQPTAIAEALGVIVNSAFGLEAAGGGVVGAIINGVQRATYSSEAGVGSAAIAHAAVKTDNPLTEGYVALLEPFIDTVVVCSVTGLLIVATGVYEPFLYADKADIVGIELTSAAFAQGLSWFPYVLLASVVLFAFSTLVAWAHYGAQAAAYLFGATRRVDVVFKLLLCAVLSTGAAVSLGSIIDFTDSMLFAMSVPNVVALYLLLPELKADLRAYEKKLK